MTTDTRSFTKPLTSCTSGRFGSVTVVWLRTFLPLPYDCDCLNCNSDDKSIKRVCSNLVCATRVAGCQKGGSRDQEHLKGNYEYCRRICLEVGPDSNEVRWSSALRVEMNRNGSGRPELDPLIIFVER